MLIGVDGQTDGAEYETIWEEERKKKKKSKSYSIRMSDSKKNTTRVTMGLFI